MTNIEIIKNMNQESFALFLKNIQETAIKTQQIYDEEQWLFFLNEEN